MMKKLGKGEQENIEPNEEQRALLPSSREQNRCSSLGFSEPPVDVLLDQLAEILVEAYFYHKKHDK